MVRNKKAISYWVIELIGFLKNSSNTINSTNSMNSINSINSLTTEDIKGESRKFLKSHSNLYEMIIIGQY